MKIKVLFSLLLSGLLLSVTGCVSTVDGHAKAGVPFTKDTIVKKFQRTMPQLQVASRKVLSENGKLLVDNIAENTLEAKVNECTVWVRLDAVDPTITQVSVQARDGMRSNIELAADIATQIALQLVVTQ